MATVPEPFGHLDVPPRTHAQKKHDRKRNREQTRQLAGSTSTSTTGGPGSGTRASSVSTNGMDELVRKLKNRRSKAGPGVVQFTTMSADTEKTDGKNKEWSLVVPGELLVRHDDNGNLSGESLEVLDNNKFKNVTRAAGSRVCPELVSGPTRLSVWRHAGPGTSRNRQLLRAITELRGQASPHLVTALHAGPPPPPPIVAKAAVGPAPTEVDARNRKFRRAGQHHPEGAVRVAVIDTGIAEGNRHDGWLNEVDRVAGRRGNIDPLDKFPPPGNGKLDFAAGHGTFAAGIVRLVDPEAEIKVYRAMDSDGFASELDIACAMIRAVKEGAQVLNLSCGMHTLDDQPSVALELALDVIDEIVVRDKRTAPAIVASAGNYGNARKVWPAAFDGVISVAALNHRLQGAGWSTRGKWVTCSCVGQGIVSTFVPGDEDPKFSEHHPGWPHPDHYPLDAWAVWSGTSFAAPQIAGAISRTMRQRGLSPQDASQHLLRNQGNNIPGYGQALCLLPGT
jgi:subtilisin family serine protease